MGEFNAPQRTAPNVPKSAPLPHCAACIFGLGLLLASSLMLLNGFSPSVVPAANANIDGESFAPFFHIVELIAFAAGMGASGAVLAFVSRLRRPAPDKLLLLLGAAFAFVGLAALWMKQNVDPTRLSIPDALLCGGPVGIGNGLMFTLWARGFGVMPPRMRIAGIALSTGVGIAASTLVPLALGHNFLMEWWTAIQIATCITAAWLVHATDPRSDSSHSKQEEACTEAPASTPERQTQPCAANRPISAEHLLAIAGLALFAFILGVYWRKFSTAIFYSELLEGSAALACGIAIAVAAAALKDRAGMVLRIVLPLGAVLLLADPFLSFDIAGPMAPSGISWTACLITFVCAGLDATFASCGQRGGASTIGWATALWCATLIAGIAFGEVTDPYAFKLAITAAMIVYLAALLATYARRIPVAQATSNPTASPAEAQPSAPERALAAADKLGLSPREEEVFGFLIQGRGESYIADTLCISVSTVKTHRRNIYRKLGVGSREELLDWYEQQ